jgi:LPXTG-motif cell wall-anchored protein
MDSAQILVTIGGVALMVLTLWFFFGKREKKIPAGSGALYSCPMHPWITSNDPTANCSICGMKLVRSDGGVK